MADESGRRPGIGEGIRTGVGILSAFREAVEETIQEAQARGDFTPERAQQALSDALTRAQDAAGELRDRLDLVPRRDFDALRAEVAELRRRLDALEGRGGVPSAPLSLPAAGGSSTTAAELIDAAPGDRAVGEGPLEERMP